MDLNKHIAELLYKHECVIIPGFGGFILHPTPSYRNHLNHQFHAPSKMVAFNQQLVHNDGLLINSLMMKLNLTYAHAQQMVEKYVKSIKESLRVNEVYDLEQVGKFYYQQNGTLQFKPDSSMNFNRDSFGLTPVHAAPIIRFEQKDVEVLKSIKVKEKKEEKNKVIALNAKVIGQVAAAVLLLFGMFWQFQTYNMSVNDISMENIQQIQVSSIIENLLHDDLEINKDALKKIQHHSNKTEDGDPIEIPQDEADKIEAVEQEFKNLEEEYNKINKEIAEVKKVYHKEVKPVAKNAPPTEITAENFGAIYIIVGSFKNIDNANKMAIKLKKKGYNITTLEASNGFIRVGIYDFYSQEEAESTLKTVKVDVNKSAWIAEAEELM